MVEYLKWGLYCAAVGESAGNNFGTTDIGWNRIESDYLLPTNRNYGGGIGYIQVTSKNFQMLLEMKNSGVDVSALNGTRLGNDLASGTASINYAQGSLATSPKGGVFTLEETQALVTILKNNKAKPIVAKYCNEFYTVDNKRYVDYIIACDTSDSAKVFMLGMLPVAPYYIYLLATPPTPSNLTQASTNIFKYLSASVYGTRVRALVAYLEKADLSKNPPIDLTSDTQDGGTAEVKPDPDSSGDGYVPGNTITGENLTEVKLKANPVYLKNSLIEQIGSPVKFTRFNNWLYPSLNNGSMDDMENQQTENETNKNNDTKDPVVDTGNTTDKTNILNEWFDTAQALVGTMAYSRARPTNIPNSTDCSGYVSYIIRKQFPTPWNNGNAWATTDFVRNMSANIIASDYATADSVVQRGDILVVSTSTVFQNDGPSHVLIFDSPTSYYDHPGPGTGPRHRTGTKPSAWSGIRPYCRLIRLYK